MNTSGIAGRARLVRAFCHSIQGLVAAWKNEAAFRLEVLLTLIMLPPGLWFANSRCERILLFASVLLVLITELINSAIEATIDRISADRHPLSKIAKDTGSAAVLLALINVLATWGFIFLPGTR